MKIQHYRHIIILVIGFVATGLGYLWFVQSAHFDVFNAWTQQHIVLFFVFLFVIKIAGIVWPPIPGGILTMGSIPLLGWQTAFAIDFAGSMAGSSIAFFIARAWGIGFMARIFDHATLEKIKHIRVPREKEFEAIFIFRFFGANIVEIICYAAGMLGVRYSRFIFASIGAHVVLGLPFYYFAESVFSGRNVSVSIAFITLAVSLFIALRKRYVVYSE